MRLNWRAATILIWGLLNSTPGLAFQEAAPFVSDYAVQVSAIVREDPPGIVLAWPTFANSTGYFVYRKWPESTDWGSAVWVPGDADGYTDTDVAVGQTYDYSIWRITPEFEGHGYIRAGIRVPTPEIKGKVILLVESSWATPLRSELRQLELDMAGDGWTVLRHDMARMAIDPASTNATEWLARAQEIAVIKEQIRADYTADPVHVQAVCLFGHLPVPYSGVFAPDGQPDHLGAWPADAYYGDMTGLWTDATAANTDSADPRNHNVPGDGKFDQSILPGTVTLQVGRVDMANLPALPKSELELLRRYLNKDHQFRHGDLKVRERGLIADNFHVPNTAAPAVNGWRNFAPLFGATNTIAGDWLTELAREEYLWGYGCGPGGYAGATGVADTSQLKSIDTKVVFTLLFGNYFGDWDSEDNLLRAQLAASSYTLTSAWAGRPNWFVHPMALGETIGFCARLTQNNQGVFLGGDGMNQVHIALLGDPTLRLHPLTPPSDFVVTQNRLGGADLTWTASADSVLGYHVYQASSATGPFLRSNPSLVTGTSYTDPTFSSARSYMIRAVQVRSSGSGTYENLSQGIFAQAGVGTRASGDLHWTEGGRATWQMNDATGTAGSNPGWDLLDVMGTFSLSATTNAPFTIRIVSIDSNQLPGLPTHFTNTTNYSWTLVTASTPMVGFDPKQLRLVTSAFQGDLGGGVMSLALSADAKAIQLLFTPNRAPVARPVVLGRVFGTQLRIDIADLLAHYTSDPDGDGRALVEIGASTNGSAILMDTTSILFESKNDLPESFSYTIRDLRPYRNEDIVRTATNWITVQTAGTFPTLLSSAYRAVEIEWQSDSSQAYQLQSRPDPDSPWTNRGDLIPGTGGLLSAFERASAPPNLYRVIVFKGSSSTDSN